jgi:hypothetical protein
MVGVGVDVETSIGVGIGVWLGVGLCPKASNATRKTVRANPAARRFFRMTG